MAVTDADRAALIWARRESGYFHRATDWYLSGWKPMGYQYAWHQVTKMNATWIGGIATAKTSTNAASNTMDCLAYPYFRALNTSITAKQAELPFAMFMLWMEGNPRLEHLVEDIKVKPWPIITFKNYSTYEFRTAGLNAQFIRGFEYDRITFDECALETSEKTVETLRGRLRGTRPFGEKRVPRLARLDTITSPGAVLWLKERYMKGLKPEQQHLYFSLKTATWDNIYLTAEQIEAMKAEMPPDVIMVELGGDFPEYGAAFFPEVHVDACIDPSLYDIAYISLNPEDGSKPKEGYRLEEDGRAGITLFELPYQPGKRYVMGGDPGRGNPPHRNAGVVMAADISNPNAKRLVYCHWVAGNGSINPFMDAYRYALEKYSPEAKGLDTTGTQAMLDEIAFTNYGINTDKINYATDKHGMLNTHLADILNHRWRIPQIQGLIRQTKSYTLEDDKDIPQDLVTTWAQLSWLARTMQTGEVDPRRGNERYDQTRGLRPLVRSGYRSPISRRRRR